MTYTYIVPLVNTAESNETLIAKKVIRVLDCTSSLDVSAGCGSWNYNHCPVDKEYCNPFIAGDKIYLQFFGPQSRYSTILIQIFNSATHEEIVMDYPYLTIEQGIDQNFVGYKNAIIDTTQFENIDCFYARVKAYTCTIEDPEDIMEFDQCVSDLIEQGKTEQQAIEICLEAFCDDASIEIMFSDPYCKIFCEQESLLIEGEFPKRDCHGNFYAPFEEEPVTNSFKAQIRILGEISPVDNNIEVTFINNNTRKSTEIITTHNLRGHEKVPYYVIEKISNIFAGKKTIIDGVEYQNSIKLSKNNQQGKMWIIDESLTTSCGETDFSCK